MSRPLVIELGAGTAIPSVRHFSHRVIHEFGGRLIRINPGEWEVPTQLDVGLPMGALAGLTAISALFGASSESPKMSVNFDVKDVRDQRSMGGPKDRRKRVLR